MTLEPYDLAPYIPLTGCFLNAFFGVFVFSRSPRSLPNRIYLVTAIFIATWNLGSYFLFVVDNKVDALFWARFLHFGLITGVVALFHLMVIMAGHAVGRWIRWLYLFGIVLTLTDFTPLFIKDVRDLGVSGWYAVAGPAYHIFSAMIPLMGIGTIALLRTSRNLPKLQGRRLLPLIWSYFALILFGLNDTLPIIGFDKYPGTQVQVYPWGSLAAVFYGIVAAYSVLQYQLLDIQAGLSRAIAHIIRFTFLISITAALLLVVGLITNAFNVRTFTTALAVFVASAIIGTLLFPRLFGGTGLDNWERRIIGDRFEYQDRVRNFIENMAWFGDLTTLINGLHEQLIHSLKVGTYHIILRDETTRAFTLFRSHPEQVQRQLPELRAQSPAFRFFEWGNAEYLALNANYLRPGGSVLERSAVDQLSEFGGAFCFPFASQNEPFGLFIVGEKQTGEPYTSTDIKLLVALVKNMSLMVNQIRLKNHILQNQELDLLGRMSRGMAHDLNNLLTPIWTLLQLANEASRAGAPAAFDEELLPSALRNLKIMRAYIKEALFFSENLRPDFQLGRLDVLVAQAAEVARVSRKKNVEVAVETPGEVLVEMDEVLVQRLVANVIANAIDASPEGTTIRVELVRLVKTEASRDWLRVRVVDQGEGIRKEDLNRVFTPYFTTKTHGDEARGFGLGLAICRKIANLHGGNLSISSQLMKGTTVALDMPTRQQQPQPSAVAQPA